MKRFLVVLMAVAACDPQVMADKVVRRAAADVVMPVVSRSMPAGPAGAATECILQSASIEEQRALAQDVGVMAGTRTEANIRNLISRPATQACFAANGVSPVR